MKYCCHDDNVKCEITFKAKDKWEWAWECCKAVFGVGITVFGAVLGTSFPESKTVTLSGGDGRV